MRLTHLVLLFLLSACWLVLDEPVPAQAGWLDWEAKGWVQGSLYPPHNEFDPHPMIDFSDRTVARYGLEMNLQIGPKDFSRFFFFVNPTFLFGDSRPQLDYNYSIAPIVVNAQYGLGFIVSREHNIEVRIAQGKWIDLGEYKGEKLLWNAIQVRWSFDTGD